jgi:hypothetical protein
MTDEWQKIREKKVSMILTDEHDELQLAHQPNRSKI